MPSRNKPTRSLQTTVIQSRGTTPHQVRSHLPRRPTNRMGIEDCIAIVGLRCNKKQAISRMVHPDLNSLQAALGHTFRHEQLLIRALTHSSLAHEQASET